MKVDSEFNFSDRVKIDHGDTIGIVIGFCVYPHGLQVQVSWWNNGAICEGWFAEWRLTKVSS